MIHSALTGREGKGVLSFFFMGGGVPFFISLVACFFVFSCRGEYNMNEFFSKAFKPRPLNNYVFPLRGALKKVETHG
jgi:hypothetical protein